MDDQAYYAQFGLNADGSVIPDNSSSSNSPAANNNGTDFNSLLSTALGGATGLVRGLTSNPSTNAPAVKGTPASTKQVTGASSWMNYLIPVALVGLVLGGIAFLLGRK